VNRIMCAICGSENAKEIKRDFEAKYNQTAVVVENARMYECESCGERFFSSEQSRALSRQIKEHVRRQYGLLSPEQIVAIRHKLKLTQEELEELFGLGAKVVTRWENGRVVQARTADVALRLLAIEPSSLARLRKETTRAHAKKASAN
jgi:putative zinc finger/helix-turn-helix YgiT family protein